MRHLLSHYKGPYNGPKTAIIIAWLGGLYLTIIMDRYVQSQISLTIDLNGGLYIAIIMYLRRGPQTSLTIALLGGLYIAIIMVR
jgi:hypothetical protein